MIENYENKEGRHQNLIRFGLALCFGQTDGLKVTVILKKPKKHSSSMLLLLNQVTKFNL